METRSGKINKAIQPKGILVAIGGGDDGQDILERIKKETGKRNPKICYITVALSSFKEAKQNHSNFYKAWRRKKDVSIIHFGLRSEADSSSNLAKIKNCNAVFFGGGDQLRLSSLIGGTLVLTKIKRRYFEEEHFVVAGSSAGAAAMSTTMIISGSSRDALIKGELQLTNGFGFIPDLFIDTHFTERGRFGRVMQTIAYNPGVLGLGLGANTAAVIYLGEEMEIIGEGLAVIMDGRLINYSDITDVENGTPITIEGLKVHVLGNGKCFSIIPRKMVKAIKER